MDQPELRKHPELVHSVSNIDDFKQQKQTKLTIINNNQRQKPKEDMFSYIRVFENIC